MQTAKGSGPARRRPRDRTLVLAFAALALAVRLAFAFLYWVGEPLNHDEREYIQGALSVAASQGFEYGAEADAALGPVRFPRAPLYPLALALLSLIAGPEVFIPTVRAVQCVLGSLAVVVMAAIARRLAGSRAAVATAAIGAIHLPLAWMPAFILSETLYSALALAGVLVLVPRAQESRTRASRWRVVAGGVLAGLAALTRPIHLAVIAITAVLLVPRRRVGAAMLFLVAAAAVIGPWTVRNVLVYHRLVLIAPIGGVNFWIGNHPLAVGDGDLAANPRIALDNRRFRAEHPGLREAQLEPLYYREALRTIAEAPGRWLLLLARKAWYSIVPTGPSYALHSWRYRAASVAWWVLLLPFAVAGYARLLGAGRPAWPVLALAAGSLAAGLVFFPQERYRIPALDPVAVIGAAAWWALRTSGAPRDA
jgi:hypothetical protein